MNRVTQVRHSLSKQATERHLNQQVPTPPPLPREALSSFMEMKRKRHFQGVLRQVEKGNLFLSPGALSYACDEAYQHTDKDEYICNNGLHDEPTKVLDATDVESFEFLEPCDIEYLDQEGSSKVSSISNLLGKAIRFVLFVGK